MANNLGQEMESKVNWLKQATNNKMCNKSAVINYFKMC